MHFFHLLALPVQPSIRKATCSGNTLNMLCRQLLRRPLLLQKWRWRHHPLPALRALGVSPPSPYPGDTVDDLSHSPLLPAACIAQFIERTLGKMDRGQHAVDEWRRNRRDGVVSLDLANYAKQGKVATQPIFSIYYLSVLLTLQPLLCS